MFKGYCFFLLLSLTPVALKGASEDKTGKENNVTNQG